MANLKQGTTVGGFPVVNTLELNRRLAVLTSTLSSSASLASPTFTGNPQAPTISTATDSSTSIATTAFVQNAIGTKIKLISTSTTITTSNLPSGSIAFVY